ncbi:hypothetical protein TNCV_674911 [Trichonephila clavipes]|nr:hypothetical protein TNCV_674911 [Trichonephila clavipes]
MELGQRRSVPGADPQRSPIRSPNFLRYALGGDRNILKKLGVVRTLEQSDSTIKADENTGAGILTYPKFYTTPKDVHLASRNLTYICFCTRRAFSGIKIQTHDTPASNS